MDRLTKQINGEACHYDCNGPCGTCDGCTCFEIGQMVDRLSAYEDICYSEDETERISLARLRQLAEADRDGRCVVLKPEQQPSKDGQKKPECFYTDKSSGEFCLGYCHYGDEPIEACQECWWLDGNDDFRAEAGAALAGKEQNNEKS